MRVVEKGISWCLQMMLWCVVRAGRSWRNIQRGNWWKKHRCVNQNGWKWGDREEKVKKWRLLVPQSIVRISRECQLDVKKHVQTCQHEWKEQCRGRWWDQGATVDFLWGLDCNDAIMIDVLEIRSSVEMVWTRETIARTMGRSERRCQALVCRHKCRTAGSSSLY